MQAIALGDETLYGMTEGKCYVSSDQLLVPIAAF